MAKLGHQHMQLQMTKRSILSAKQGTNVSRAAPTDMQPTQGAPSVRETSLPQAPQPAFGAPRLISSKEGHYSSLTTLVDGPALAPLSRPAALSPLVMGKTFLLLARNQSYQRPPLAGKIRGSKGQHPTL